MKKIMVSEPQFFGSESKYVNDCLSSTWISSAGKYITQFEEIFAKFCNVKYAIATNNGTTALHLAMIALGLQEEDEVIIPTVTYIATANSVKYCNAKPILVDVLPDSLNIDPDLIESKINSKTKGIIAVHLYGHPADMDAINKIAKKYGLWVVEDAAEAHGAEYKGNKVGGLSDCAIFSFFGNKIITTGEGGMITTNDAALADRLKLYRGQGMSQDRRYWFDVVGYNYRMTNVQAAIGCAQMEGINKALSIRERLARMYDKALERLSDCVYIPKDSPWAKNVHWMYTIFLKNSDCDKRNQLISYLADNGIESRPVFYPMHVLPPYRDTSIYNVADIWSATGLNLPTHYLIGEAEVEYIVKTISDFFNNE